MTRLRITHPTSVFLVVWTTQLVSALGTGLTEFALGVIVYQRTGSATQFALVMVCAMVPAILLSPFSGTLADRWDRRRMMLAGNAASGVVILALAVLQQQDALALWQIYLSVTLLAVFGAVRDPAYYASVSQMVPKSQLGRASGMVQTGENVGMVAPPLIAGVLLVTVGLGGILAIDAVSYVLGVAALLMVAFPPLERSDDTAATKPSLWRDTVAGWRYMTTFRGLFYVSLFGAFVSFCVGLTQIVVTPLVLSFETAAVLGAVFSAGGFGIFVGGLVMAAWGGPKRQILGVLSFGLVQVVALFVAGLRASAVLIGVGLFAYLFAIQFVRGCTATIIRTHVPQDMQARIFSLNRFVAWSSLPIAYLLAGPLVDTFEPWLREGGALAGSAGHLLGVGPGRGIGLLLTVLSAALLVAVLASFANPRLRNVEDEMRALTTPADPAETPADAPEAGVRT